MERKEGGQSSNLPQPLAHLWFLQTKNFLHISGAVRVSTLRLARRFLLTFLLSAHGNGRGFLFHKRILPLLFHNL